MPADVRPLARLRAALWPDSSVEEHARELALILKGKPPTLMPLVEFVAEEPDGTLVGFVEAGLRSYVDGCDTKRPVGYIEGWFVAITARRRGIGKLLIEAAEEWARHQGCVEMGSDAEIANGLSQIAHLSLGYEETGRAVMYRKSIRRDSSLGDKENRV